MKHLFKRFAAGVTAACMCAALAVPMESEAVDSPYDGDLNGDGTVSMTDMTILNKYLSGMCSLNDPTPGDVNCNLVVDVVDQQILLSYLVGSLGSGATLPYCDVPLTDELCAAVMDISRIYIKHDCATESNSQYSLYGSDVTTYAAPRIGVYDDRVWDSDTAVVHLSSGSTGFIIGENLIVTAAHCLYDTATRTFNTDIDVIIRGEPLNGVSQEIDRYDAVELHIPKKFYLAAGDYMMYDYALIYVDAVTEDNEEGLLKYGSFNLGNMSDAFHGSGASVTVSGFPGSAELEGTSYGARLKETGSIVDIRDNPAKSSKYTHQLQFDPFFSSGQSGGPIYMTTTFKGKTYRTAVGIATSGAASDDGSENFAYYGTRITSNLLRFYYYNDNIGSTST